MYLLIGRILVLLPDTLHHALLTLLRKASVEQEQFRKGHLRYDADRCRLWVASLELDSENVTVKVVLKLRIRNANY